MTNFDSVYYEPQVFEYDLGKQLKDKFSSLQWFQIENHNSIEQMRSRPNSDFPQMKRHLIIGTRKTHKYVPNFKVSDYLVPFTSSGCSAMCLYCYLVCNYNKCAYLRLFVNREQMLEKLIKFANKQSEPKAFEIGSNSDLVLENTITQNLEWVIPKFAEQALGKLTFPTKFHQVDSLLNLDHRGKVIFRMSVNPPNIIKQIEIGTSLLDQRIEAANKMFHAGYPVGILIAPVILTKNWMEEYSQLLDILREKLDSELQNQLIIEIIFMTYSYVQRAINAEAFPTLPSLYDANLMTGRGMGKYHYRVAERQFPQEFIKSQISEKLPKAKIVYIC